MSFRHTELAAGRWRGMPFVEQMAHIGSEVERALNWQVKRNDAYCQKAFERALELIDLTLDGVSRYPLLKELARVREALVGYFTGSDQSGSTEASWRRYFEAFTYAARRKY